MVVGFNWLDGVAVGLVIDFDRGEYSSVVVNPVLGQVCELWNRQTRRGGDAGDREGGEIKEWSLREGDGGCGGKEEDLEILSVIQIK